MDNIRPREAKAPKRETSLPPGILKGRGASGLVQRGIKIPRQTMKKAKLPWFLICTISPWLPRYENEWERKTLDYV